HRGQVSLARVWQYGDDGFTGKLGLLCEPYGHRYRCAGRNADEHALLARQAPCKGECFPAIYLLDTVNQRQIQRLRNEAGADALDFMRTRLEFLARKFLRDNRAFLRLDSNRDDLFALGLLD